MSRELREFTDWTLFAKELEPLSTIFYDFDRHKLSIYNENSEESEAPYNDDELSIASRIIYFLATEEINLYASQGINLAIALAAFGKNVIVSNFNAANENFWGNAQAEADKLAKKNDKTVGQITFLPKEDEELDKREVKEKIFLKELTKNPKPKIIYHIRQNQFFVYLGSDPEKRVTDIKNKDKWAFIKEYDLKDIIGYNAFGWIDHTVMLSSLGYDVEIWTKDSDDLDMDFSMNIKRMSEGNKHRTDFDFSELKGEITFSYYGEEAN